MRKILIILLIILLVFLGYIGFTKGISIGFTEIRSYNSVQDTYSLLNNRIQEINEKKSTEFVSKKNELEKTFEEYTKLKEDYEKKIKNLSISADKSKNIFAYDIDYLWARIGTHATSEGVDIDLDIAENSSIATVGENYRLCDFYFTVSGAYKDITAFIYHLEDDEELKFSIENFKLEPLEKGKIVATFKVTEMPLNVEDLNIWNDGMSFSNTSNDDTKNVENNTNNEQTSLN